MAILTGLADKVSATEYLLGGLISFRRAVTKSNRLGLADNDMLLNATFVNWGKKMLLKSFMRALWEVLSSPSFGKARLRKRCSAAR